MGASNTCTHLTHSHTLMPHSHLHCSQKHTCTHISLTHVHTHTTHCSHTYTTSTHTQTTTFTAFMCTTHEHTHTPHAHTPGSHTHMCTYTVHSHTHTPVFWVAPHLNSAFSGQAGLGEGHFQAIPISPKEREQEHSHPSGSNGPRGLPQGSRNRASESLSNNARRHPASRIPGASQYPLDPGWLW